MPHNSVAVARDAAKTAALNLETVANLIEGQDALKVSGTSLAALLRPIIADMFSAYDELQYMGDLKDGK
ncbi:hypothetical protein [Azonexus sp.]|uniref:hypothetical protein n=1 Tax=Azonexus sp. TaxID=1872668 RepID=UPI0035AFA707